MMATLYALLFLGVPAALLVLFVVSLVRYTAARKQNRQCPGTVPPEAIKTRLILLIITSVLAGGLLAVPIGVIVLLFTAIAFM